MSRDVAAADPHAPAVGIDALEAFVHLLAQVQDDDTSDAFYSRMCEATCRLANMDRAVIFRYDEARRRVYAAGAWGLDIALFAGAHVTVESAPIARQALVEDRVIEVGADVSDDLPEEYRPLVRDATPTAVRAGCRSPPPSATSCGRWARPPRSPPAPGWPPTSRPARASSRSASTSRATCTRE
jgi:hypothetical protein